MAEALGVRRIVSLLPSGTEIVCALGLGERLVGVSHSCDYPAAVHGKPRVSRARISTDGLSGAAIDAAVRQALREHGSVYEVAVDALAALAPDLVLTQGICDVCAVPEREVLAAVAAFPAAPHVLALDAHDVRGILAGIRSVAAAAGVPGEGDACTAEIDHRIAAVRARVADRPRPRVLALEWLDPPYVPGHWVPELFDAAGGDLVLGVAGRPSFVPPGGVLADADPDVLIVMPCGFGLEQARAEAGRHTEWLHALAPRAVTAGRAYVVDASAYFSRPGPRVADGLEVLAALLHPTLFPDAALAGRAARWSSDG